MGSPAVVPVTDAVRSGAYHVCPHTSISVDEPIQGRPGLRKGGAPRKDPMRSSLVSSLLLALLVACTATDPEPSSGPRVELVDEVEGAVDSTPTADGSATYVVTDTSAGSQLLHLADGEAHPLASFEHARAVVTDAAGIVYVADTGVDAVFAVPPELTNTVVAGTEGLGARALHLGDALYVAGDDGTGRGAVFEVPRDGGTATMIAGGFPGFVDGIVVADDGTLYVTGEATAGAGAENGALFEVVDGEPTALAEGIHLGTPAGVALTPDEATVMVSSLSDQGTSQVLLVAREDGSTSSFDDVIGVNVGSGGLHSAASKPEVSSWCGVAGGSGGGRVYGVEF